MPLVAFLVQHVMSNKYLEKPSVAILLVQRAAMRNECCQMGGKNEHDRHLSTIHN